MAALLLVVVLLLIDGIASAPFGGHLEAAMASEATKMAVLDIMHIGSKVMEVIEHHMPISHSPCRRRS